MGVFSTLDEGAGEIGGEGGGRGMEGAGGGREGGGRRKGREGAGGRGGEGWEGEREGAGKGARVLGGKAKSVVATLWFTQNLSLAIA